MEDKGAKPVKVEEQKETLQNSDLNLIVRVAKPLITTKQNVALPMI